MADTILLAAALQNWDRYSAHALAARDVAASLAAHASKSLHVLSVYEYEKPRAQMDMLPADVIARFREQEIQRVDMMMAQKLDEYVQPLLAQGLNVKKTLRVGSPRDQIVQVAEEIHADLLVIGSHSKRGLFDIALGGTAQQVAKHAPCTVILVSPSRQERRNAKGSG